MGAIATLTACAQGAGPATDSREPLASRGTPTSLRSADPGAGDGSPTSGEVPDAIVAAIITDAIERSGATEDEISVDRAEAVTWDDGSLGCPEPDMSYTQALVDGYHVVLDVAGETLDYRVGSGSDFRLCDSPIEGGG